MCTRAAIIAPVSVIHYQRFHRCHEQQAHPTDASSLARACGGSQDSVDASNPADVHDDASVGGEEFDSRIGSDPDSDGATGAYGDGHATDEL